MVDKIKLYEKAAQVVVEGDKERAEEIARQILKTGLDPLEAISKGFTVGIARVGEHFELGEMFLPELIMCSEVMKNATDILNEAIDANKKQTIGKILIATVEGDVHDIGKGIVVSLLSAHGFAVTDMGRDIPIPDIVAKAEEIQADIIGTSALLTTTMEGQKKLEELLRERGLKDKYKTIVGGAPVTERWAKKIGADAYAEDANDGVKKAFELLGKN